MKVACARVALKQVFNTNLPFCIVRRLNF